MRRRPIIPGKPDYEKRLVYVKFIHKMTKENSRYYYEHFVFSKSDVLGTRTSAVRRATVFVVSDYSKTIFWSRPILLFVDTSLRSLGPPTHPLRKIRCQKTNQNASVFGFT